MQKLETLLDELETAFTAEPRYFQSSESLALAYFGVGVKPILKRVATEVRRLLNQQYTLNHQDAEGSVIDRRVELVHYTTIESLVSILGGIDSLNDHIRTNRDNPNDTRTSDRRDTSSIRLYETEHFNDPEEGEYLIRSLGLYEKYEWLERHNAPSAYVASFVHADDGEQASDDLVYWRTYGNDGAGCSITVSVPRKRIHKVLYGTDGASRVGDVIYFLLDKFGHIISEYKLRSGIRRELSTSVWEMLQYFLYLHKSNDYSFERECRLVELGDDISFGDLLFECDWRTVGTLRIRHYIEREELAARNILVSGTCVTLGPNVTQRGSVTLLIEALLRTSGLPTQVKFSEISYRESQR